MSTWTSKIVILAALAVSACAALPSPSRNAPTAIKLPDGMVVAGARGWCVDAETTHVAGNASVVVLGSCASLANDARLPRPPVRGVVTVSVEAFAADLPPADVLKTFFRTRDGRAALARDGHAESVEVLDMMTSRDALIIHARDASAPAPTIEDTWRAIFDIDGRFITISLKGIGNTTLPPGRGLAALDAQIARIRSVN